MFKTIRHMALPVLAVAFFAFSIYHLLFASTKLPLESPPVDPPRRSFASGISGTGLIEAKTENIALRTWPSLPWHLLR